MDWKKPIHRAPAVRLTSSAVYTRPLPTDHTADIPMLSTHRVSYTQPAAEMKARCVESRRSVKSANMVREAAALVPIDAVDAHEAAVAAHFAAATASELEAVRARAAALAERGAPSASPAEARLAGLLAALPRCGMENQLVKTDFQTSGVPATGPYPGSVSAYGRHQSEQYWQVCKDAAAGRLHTVKPPGLNHLGVKFKH